jgi:hypothetical protein
MLTLQRLHSRRTVHPWQVVPATAPSTQVIPTTRRDEARKRTYVDVAPSYLTKFFDNHTAIQARKLLEVYIGNWMCVSGILKDIDGRVGRDWVTVSLEKTLADPLILFYFDKKKWADQITMLPRGTKITIAGQIDQIDSMSIRFEHCEVVRNRRRNVRPIQRRHRARYARVYTHGHNIGGYCLTCPGCQGRRTTFDVPGHGAVEERRAAVRFTYRYPSAEGRIPLGPAHE